MTEKKNGRGGAREGAGRPRELDESCKPRAIYCSFGEKQEMEKFLAIQRVFSKYNLNMFALEVPFGDLYSFMQSGTGMGRILLCREIPEEAVEEIREKIKTINEKVRKFRVRTPKKNS